MSDTAVTEEIFAEETAKLILESLTPIDSGVFADLSGQSKADHLRDLLKRLSMTAEVTAPGRGAELLNEVWSSALAPDELLQEIDAVLEFGARFADLTPEDQDKAARAEIRQEILHFDRIMDLESLTSGRSSLKRRRDFVHQDGLLGSAERLLVLVQERMMLRGVRPLHWRDSSAQPQRLLGASNDGATMRRTSDPHFIAVSAAGDSERSQAPLAALEPLLLRHPLSVALAMVDYQNFLAGEGAAQLSGATFTRKDDGHLAEIWTAGDCTWIVVEKYDVFHQRVINAGNVAAAPLGESTSVYGNVLVHIPAGASLILTSATLDTSDLAALTTVADRRNDAGRIELLPNMSAIVGAAPIIVGKPDRIQNAAAPVVADYEEDIRDFSATLLRSSSSLNLSIECGHIHADREMGPTQIRGLDLGANIVSELSRAAGSSNVALSVDVAPMVDDDHVLNRFSFQRYRELFSEYGLSVGDLILESSPLPRAVAHDVLRRAVERQGQGFTLNVVGRNLYLEAGDMRVELIEDLEGEMRNGCILFEVGLVMYRATRLAMAETYWKELGESQRDLHREMSERYDAAPDPLVRADIRRYYEKMYPDPWANVIATSTRTPFLDVYEHEMASREASETTTTVLNVLEDYYRPQQEKVQKLAQLLGIELPMRSVFFSPYARGLQFVDYSAVQAAEIASGD